MQKLEFVPCVTLNFKSPAIIAVEGASAQFCFHPKWNKGGRIVNITLRWCVNEAIHFLCVCRVSVLGSIFSSRYYSKSNVSKSQLQELCLVGFFSIYMGLIHWVNFSEYSISGIATCISQWNYTVSGMNKQSLKKHKKSFSATPHKSPQRPDCDSPKKSKKSNELKSRNIFNPDLHKGKSFSEISLRIFLQTNPLEDESRVDAKGLVWDCGGCRVWWKVEGSCISQSAKLSRF